MSVAETQSWVTIIASLATAIVAIITAWKVKSTGTKVDEVHLLVNSQATADKAKIELLQSILVAKQLEVDAAERARASLAKSTATQLATVLPTKGG